MPRTPDSPSFLSLSETAKELRTERKKSRFIESISVHGIMDSSMESFSYSFRHILPDDVKSHFKDLRGNAPAFREYIEKTIGSETSKAPLVAIEFGGPGSRLFSEFTPGFFEQTLGVLLTDQRKLKTKESDEKRNHSVMIGNILNSATYGKAQRMMKDKDKVDPIVKTVVHMN